MSDTETINETENTAVMYFTPDEVPGGYYSQDGKCYVTREEAQAANQAFKDQKIREVKQFRVELDGILQRMQNPPFGHWSEREYATVKLKEAIMWLGMELKAIGAENPYPNSYKPENTIVDPTADGLTL